MANKALATTGTLSETKPPAQRRAPARPRIKIRCVLPIDSARALVDVELPGPIIISSILVVGMDRAPNERRVLWPRTPRGYAPVEVGELLKARIDRAVLVEAAR